MALTDEQAKQIKQQLMQQIKNLPPEQGKALEQQIKNMNNEQLEQFLIQNNLIKKPGQQPGKETGSGGTAEQAGGQGGGCIFCNISEGKTQSHKIDENKKAIAVLDINPLTKGHSIVIPKQHLPIEKSSSPVLSLAKKIAKKLKSKLKAQDVKIETANVQGHGLINVIPFYENEKPEKKQAKPEELKKLQEKLKVKPRKQRKKAAPKKLGELPHAPKRIP
jgi:histidine triad (HIT) family protein